MFEPTDAVTSMTSGSISDPMATMISAIVETEATTLCLSDGNTTYVLTAMSSMLVASAAYGCSNKFDDDNDAELLAHRWCSDRMKRSMRHH